MVISRAFSFPDDLVYGSRIHKSLLRIFIHFSAQNHLKPLGEYIGKIYKEVKHRPRFVIDQLLND